jgi:adenosylcobyric acid synthase
MKVAKLNDTPVLLVADVDRGGALADVVGTLQLLPAEERKLVQGIVLNKFRGDYELLKPGVEFLEEKTGLPVVGVLPYLKDINIPDEDSVALSNFFVSDPAIRIAVINLPHISNFTDFDQLGFEPEVELKYVSSTDNLTGFDALIIPGTKNTMADLNYLQETGLATKINELAGQGVEIVGICGGYQILGSKLYDPELTEGQSHEQTGLDLLDVVTTFRSQKSTEQVRAEVQAQQGFFSQLATKEVTGYEIHMGQTQLGSTAEPLFKLTSRSGEAVELFDGACNPEASVWGTYLHGIFANDQLRRGWINYLRAQKGLDPVKEELSRSGEELEADYQQLAQVVRENLDMELVYKIMREGQK